MAMEQQYIQLRQNKLFLPKDIMASQGWPMCSTFAPLIPFDRSKLTMNQAKVLMGNGQHLAQCGSVFAYIMAFSVRRDTVTDLYPPCLGRGPSTTPPRSRHWKRHLADMLEYEKKQEEKRARQARVRESVFGQRPLETRSDAICVDTLVYVQDSLEEVEFDYAAEVPGSQGSQGATPGAERAIDDEDIE